MWVYKYWLKFSYCKNITYMWCTWHMLVLCHFVENLCKPFEPPHDKTRKWAVCPAMTQISFGIRPVWSESSLSTWKKKKKNSGSSATDWTHCEDSDQTGRMSRLIWVFVGRTYHFVGFVMRWLIWKIGIYSFYMPSTMKIRTFWNADWQ